MNLSRTEEIQIMQAGRHHLIDFSILTNRKYKPNWHHKVIADELEKAEKGLVDWKILILMEPPRHGKSEEASINFPAWLLGRNPEREIITASYSSELALDFGGKTRDLIRSEEYKLIFGQVNLREDEQAKAKWKTNQGGSYISTGIGGALTGRGADWLIIDDPIKNREESESKLIRDKHWNWFISTAYTRLQPQGKVVLILTRWHLDDLAGRIMANPEFATMLKIMSFPAIAEHDEQYRKKGEVLWPDRYSLEEIESIKRASGTYNFNSLYQQHPILSENQEFRESWFQNIEYEEVKRQNTRNFLTIDTAISKRESADNTGICKNYVNKENKWNLKAFRLRINPKQLIELLFQWQEEDNFEQIGIEETIYLDAIKPFLEDEQRKRNKFLLIVPLKHKQIAKEVRIRGLIPRYESHSINHIKGECNDLEDEALTFPMGLTDDVLDATAYQNQIAEAPFQTKPYVQEPYRGRDEYDWSFNNQVDNSGIDQRDFK